MIDARILVVLGLSLGAVAAPAGHLARVVLSQERGELLLASPADKEQTAWALIAEADELCEALPTGDTLSGAVGSGVDPGMSPRALRERSVVARRAVALEALGIVRELAGREPSVVLGESVRQAERRVQRCCSGAPRGLSNGYQLRSLDGLGRLERGRLIAPFLGRLNEAARADLKTVPERSEAIRRSEEAAPVAVVGATEARKATEAREVVEEARTPVPTEPPQPRDSQVSRGIEIGPASSPYRERVRHWLRVFEPQARALRSSRTRLQAEIERTSMAEARDACRAFGLTLARLDPKLTMRAPTRGLSIRIERMLKSYWRGVARCSGGRPAAAFGHLSEGDREWVRIRETADRLSRPRPMVTMLADPGPPQALRTRDP